MQSTAFILSPSLTLHKPRRPFISNRFDPTHFSLSASSSKPDESSSSSFHRRYWSAASLSSSSSSSFKFRPSTSLPTPASSDSDATRFETRATSVPESSDEGSNALSKTLQLGSLFGLWYLFNIYFNIYNKQILKYILKRYQRPNKDPSYRVFDKALEPSSALSGTEVARVSKRVASESEEAGVGRDVEGLNLKEEDEEATDQYRRWNDDEELSSGLEEEAEREKCVGSKRLEIKGLRGL